MNDLPYDENLSIMVKATQGKVTNKQETLSAIRKFRKNLNLKWFVQFNLSTQQFTAFLKEIWLICFRLLELDDQQINISFQNTLGSIIFFVGKFISGIAIDSFLKAVQIIKPSRNTSISVIACYCAITHNIPLIHMHDFYSSIPILIFFGPEIADNLKYLPHLFRSMKPINAEINFVIFRTLIKTFYDQMATNQNPLITSNLIKSLFELICNTPSILEHEEELLKTPKIALILYPMILQNKDLEGYIYKSDLKKIFNIAINILKDKEKQNITDFEQASLLVAIVLAKQSDNSLLFYDLETRRESRPKKMFKYIPMNESPEKEKMFKEQHESYNENSNSDDFIFELDFEIDFSQLRQNYWAFAYKLTNDLSIITPNKEVDQMSIQAQKIDAFKYYIRRNPKNIIQCLEILEQFLDTNSEVFSHVIDTIASILEFLDNKYNKIEDIDKIVYKLKVIFSRIFSLNIRNWVQQLSLCHLFKTTIIFYSPLFNYYHENNQHKYLLEEEAKLIKNQDQYNKTKNFNHIITEEDITYFRKTRICLLLNYSLSKQENLCDVSLDIFINAITINELSFLYDFITKQDLFDDYVIYRLLLIINKTAEIFGYEIFNDYNYLIGEIISVSESINTITQFLIYMNRSKSFVITPIISSQVEKLFFKLFQGLIGFDVSFYPTTSASNFSSQNDTQINQNLHAQYSSKIESTGGSYDSEISPLIDMQDAILKTPSKLQQISIEQNTITSQQNQFHGSANSPSDDQQNRKQSKSYKQKGSNDNFQISTSDIDTNIITGNFDSNNMYFKAFKECFAFMILTKELPPLIFHSVLVCMNIIDIDVLIPFLDKFKDQYRPLILNKLISIADLTNDINKASKVASIANNLGILNEKLLKSFKSHLQLGNFNGEQLFRFSECVDKSFLLKCSSTLKSADSALFYYLYSNDYNVSLELTKISPYEEWPLFNPKYHSFIEEQLSQLQPILIRRKFSPQSYLQQMDPIHQKFINDHIDYFIFEEEHEMYKNIFYLERHKKFKSIVDQNISKEASIVPSLFIKDENIVDNVDLLKNFCHFSTIELPNEIFEQLAKILVEKELFQSLFLLSKNQRKTIPSEIFNESYFSLLNDDDFIACASSYSAIGKPSEKIEKLFNEISNDFPNPLLQIRKSKRAKALVIFSPESSLKKFMLSFQPTKKYVKSMIYFASNFHSFFEFQLTMALLYSEAIEKQRKIEFDDYIEQRKMDYEIEAQESAANGITIPPLNLDNINEDDVVEHKDLTWLFRAARIFTFSAHRIPDEIESLFEKAKTATEIAEIAGIYRNYALKKHLKLNHSSQIATILFLDGLANAGKFNIESFESLFYSLTSSLPSFHICCIRALKNVAPSIQSDVFQKAYLSLFPKMKEYPSYIVISEYKYLLLHLLGTSSQHKVYQDYIYPMTEEFFNSLQSSAIMEILYDIFPKQVSKKHLDDSAFQISEYFKKGAPKPDIDSTSGIIMEYQPLGAAYFIFGQIDTLQFNFFTLYIILYKILCIMKSKSHRIDPQMESNYKHFIEVEAPQIVSHIVHKERKLSISYLIKGDIENILKGAQIAASQNSV